MRLIKFLIALCLIGKSLQVVKFFQEKPSLVKQLACVNTALKTYHNYHRNIRIFSANSSCPVNSLMRVPVTLITTWDLLHKELHSDTGPIIIFLEGNSDRDFDGLKHLHGLVLVKPVLIVCITDIVCSSEMYMKKIVEMVANAELHYVVVNEQGIIDIYEYTIMAEGGCGVPQLWRLGHCSDKSKAKRVFQTSVNFHKCPMRVATWVCPPYSEICNSDYPSNQLCGVAGNLVQIITEKVNATPVMLMAQAPHDVRQHIANRDADLGYGELDNRIFEGVSYSQSYMVVQATIVAPHSTWVLKRTFGNILRPLENEVWIGIVVVIASIFILRRLIPYFRIIHALQLFGIFIGIPVPRQPRGLPIRIYFFSLLLFGYLCSQSYLANLTKVLSAPQEPAIRTLGDLENSNLRVAGVAAARVKFETEYPRIYRDFQVHDDLDYYENLYQLLQGYSNLSAAYYVEDLDTNIAEWKNVEALQDRVNWFPIVLAAPNTSSLLKSSNKILTSFRESGMANADASFTPASFQLPQYRGSMASGKSTELGFNELKYVFFFLIAGLTLSFFVFVIEISTAFFKKKFESKGGNNIQVEWSRHRRVHNGVQLPRQTIRTRRY